MTRSELLEMITNGENSGVEFKRDDIRPEQLAKEIVAFANFKGGRVLLGVEANGAISGITRPQLEEWVMNAISGRVTPQIIPYYEEVETEPGKRVAIVSVESGANKPYALRDGDRLDFFIRVGSESRRADRDTLRRLFQASESIHTVEKMKAGVRIPRNPIIMRTMQDCGYVEAMGMGVRNMIRQMLAHNGTEPEFIETEDRFVVRLWRERKSTTE